MEFSYRINEAQYAKAWRLSRKGMLFGSVRKIALFVVFSLVCLVLLWSTIQHLSGPTPVADDSTASVQQSTTFSFATNLAPFAVLAVVWAFILLGPRRQLRSRYRKDPVMQGVLTVEITPDRLRTENTVGTSGQTGWDIYDFWREDAKNKLIVLVMKSQNYFVLNLADLPEPQQNEVRMLLGQVLPQK
jgi:hypothetical protein